MEGAFFGFAGGVRLFLLAACLFSFVTCFSPGGVAAFKAAFGFDAFFSFEPASAFGAVCAFEPAAFEPSALGTHTLAPSSQPMPALSQSALVSGWLDGPAANAVGATTKALPNTKIEAIAFIASLRKVFFEEPDVTWSCLFRQSGKFAHFESFIRHEASRCRHFAINCTAGRISPA